MNKQKKEYKVIRGPFTNWELNQAAENGFVIYKILPGQRASDARYEEPTMIMERDVEQGATS